MNRVVDKMRQCVLGIDLGTSSVKIVKKYRDGHIEKLKNTYEEPLPWGWWNSIVKLLEKIEWKEVTAIGLSSQVGTYIVNHKEVISWNSTAGREEVKWWKNNYPKEKFIEEISMPHPDIISYPLPRLKYIKEHFENLEKVYQPKEYILEKLTGELVTDAYSWRGLANLETGTYSAYFLQELFIEEKILPKIKRFDEIAGYTKEICFENNLLPAGIPVYVGLNDYYAGLLGMGIYTIGQMFDVTGTSEHLGVLQKEMSCNTALVSGPYIEHMVHYGVTASSGSSIKYGLKLMQKTAVDSDRKHALSEENVQAKNKALRYELDFENIIQNKPPIFLPYTKGAFFGIEENCSIEQMAYAVMEGVVFSLYHIYETMGKPEIEKITVSGGAATIDYLNFLKAEVFGVPLETVEESDVSALGACMVAAVGEGLYPDYHQIANEWVKINQRVIPWGKHREWFEKRFEIYKEFYFKIESLYQKWKEI